MSTWDFPVFFEFEFSSRESRNEFLLAVDHTTVWTARTERVCLLVIDDVDQLRQVSNLSTAHDVKAVKRKSEPQA